MTTIEMLSKQLEQIPHLRALPSMQHQDFKQWHQVTHVIIQRKLGENKSKQFPSEHYFWPNHFGPWDDFEKAESLNSGLDDAEAFLKGLISELELFGDEDAPSIKPEREAEKSEQSKKDSSFRNITISGGNVMFGDGNRITQVSVKELVDALREEITEKVPESDEKKSILQSLKDITTNETFASVSGAFIGEVLKRITLPH